MKESGIHFMDQQKIKERKNFLYKHEFPLKGST